MIGHHTPGRLIVVSGGSEPAAYLQDEQHFAVARVINVGLTGVYAANARRLAACWNFCDGMPTETIKGAKMPAFKYLTDADQHSHNLCNELAAARALLRDALETFDENWAEDHEIADRIRSHLEARDALGGEG